MLTLRNTPNEAGLEISGDYQDLDTLYLALHTIAGDEGDYGGYFDGARLRVLGICYDLRHAMMGDREVKFVDNGMDVDTMKLLGIITPENNLYYKVNVYYPEVLFVTMALNDFIRLYAKKQAKSSYSPLVDKKNIWDPWIANVRLFQSEVMKCVKNTVSEASFKRMMNMMNKDYPWMNGYATQYLDMLNIRYLNAGDREERQKVLPTMVKRMVEQGKEYQEVEQDVREVAKQHNCSVEDVGLKWDYPEDVDW